MKKAMCVALAAVVLLAGGVVPGFAASRGGSSPGHSGGRGGSSYGHYGGHGGYRGHGHAHWRPGFSFYAGPGYWWPGAYWGGWYGYPYRYAYPYGYGYGYSPYAPPVVTQQEPTVYIERGAEQQPASGYWYYCEDPKGYYPYVQQCPQGWMTVVPSAPAR